MKKTNILFVHEAASQASILSNYLYNNFWSEFNINHILYFDHKYYKKWNPNIIKNLGLTSIDVKNTVWKILSWFKILFFILKNSKIILMADVIHFFAWSTFLPKNIDLFFLRKIMKKKIIMEFNWSDVRKPDLSKKINPFFIYWKWGYCNSDYYVDKKIKKIDKYVDKIIVPYFELFFNVNSSIKNENKIEILFHIIDEDFLFNTSKNENNKIKIIHAPSNKWIKWSEYIIKIIKNLQKKYENIYYEELTNIPRNTILEKIWESDIVIDQLILWDFWVFSLESMYNNKITLCYLLDTVLNKYSKELPIINVNINNLELKLEDIILNIDDYKKIWNKWKKYIDKYNSENVIWKKYIKIINTL